MMVGKGKGCCYFTVHVLVLFIEKPMKKSAGTLDPRPLMDVAGKKFSNMNRTSLLHAKS